jgi:hypothetical protein
MARGINRWGQSRPHNGGDVSRITFGASMISDVKGKTVVNNKRGEIMFKTKISLPTVLLLMMLLVTPLSVHCAEGQTIPFKIRDEIRVSSEDMNCNYHLEHNGFCKLLIRDDADPIIAFVDIASQKLIFSGITDGKVKILNNQQARNNQIRGSNWPTIFTTGDKICLAMVSELPSDEGHKVEFSLFDRNINKIVPNEVQTFKIDKRCSLSGIYPLYDKFMIIGTRSYLCLHHILSLFSGRDVVYDHNVSFVMDGSKELAYNRIDEPGCYQLFGQTYAVSESGVIHGAWGRHTISSSLWGMKYNEMLYYSMTKDGMTWSAPLELYSIKAGVSRIRGLSLTTSGDTAMFLWRDIDSGIFLSEIRDGKILETTKIKDMKIPGYLAKNNPIVENIPIELASDKEGNVYVLWANNAKADCRLYFKARMNGQWTEETIINKGRGGFKYPDMSVDKDGNVHITYIKPFNPDDERLTFFEGGKQGCFYMKLERQKKDASKSN